MRIRMGDGKEFAGATAADVVEALRSACLLPPQSTADYMVGTAGRVLLFRGVPLTYTDEASFLMSLNRLGLVKIMEGREHVCQRPGRISPMVQT